MNRKISIGTTAQQTQRYGVTDPISVAEPKPEDLVSTEQLINTLCTANFFEDEDESLKREIVLGKLNVLVKAFIKRVGMEQGMSAEMAAQTGGKIYSFGSYRLGVHSKGADIDTLCVAPQHVSRSDFFTTFYDMLKEDPLVTALAQVADAYVPVINLEFDGIAIDLLFAQLSMTSIPENLNLLDIAILKNLDDKCIVSLNGSRTTDQILSLIPNISTFHTALRCIKLWAKRRGLYNNSLGYIGGVACAILAARICQLYPNAAASTIVSRFFSIYSSWQWPQPIMLKRIEYDSPTPRLSMKVWNPRTNPTDRNHRMPIITPAFPSMCSTHNVNNSTFNLMKHEFHRGKLLAAQIEEDQATWADLLERTDFFFRFKNFIQISAISKNSEAHQIWKGFVESKIRLLVTRVETLLHVNGTPPFPDAFSMTTTERNTEAILKQLIFNENINNSILPPHGLTDDVNPGSKLEINGTTNSNENEPNSTNTEVYPTEEAKTFVTTFYLALEIQPITEATPGPRKLNLAGAVADFKRLLQSWDKYKAEDMEIYIRDLKRSQLPTEVFEGRPRPPVPVKKAPVLTKDNVPTEVEPKEILTEVPKFQKESDDNVDERIEGTPLKRQKI